MVRNPEFSTRKIYNFISGKMKNSNIFLQENVKNPNFSTGKICKLIILSNIYQTFDNIHPKKDFFKTFESKIHGF